MMLNGYSKKVIGKNIANLRIGGMPRGDATRQALTNARACYFRAHPSGALPENLAYPKSNRLAFLYNVDGTPAIKNPSSDNIKAQTIYEKFSGHKAKSISRNNVAQLPDTLLHIGKINAIVYTTKRDGKIIKFIHQFKKRKSQPDLCVSVDGCQLAMVNGNYKFTKNGIEDT